MTYLAIDLGAGSGRAIAVTFEQGSILLNEVHRFGNGQVRLGDRLYWDFPALFAEIKRGIALAVRKGCELNGIAVDTWGVDFGLIDKNGNLLSNPICYRDSATKGMLQKSFAMLPKDAFYKCTGNQFLEINTAFRLLSMQQNADPQLDIAEHLLFTPDLINYFLTGKINNEYTIASTSQLLNAQNREWESTVFDKLGLPKHLMNTIIQPGNIIGKLRSDIAEETGAFDVEVVAVGSHDTASAVAAIPTITDGGWAYLSSGTWSLMGIETDNAIMTIEAMNDDFTNEGGVGGKIRFLCNITGLWLLQCLTAEWGKDGHEVDITLLLKEAAQAPAFKAMLNPDDELFTNPISPQAAIDSYCAKTNQPKPQTKGEYVRTILESLALKYAQVMQRLQKYSPKKIECLHIVGGGSRNELLNQFTADALGISVIAGPVEATALGNAMMQAICKGEINSIEEGRKRIQQSFELNYYEPQNTGAWQDVLKKYFGK